MNRTFVAQPCRRRRLRRPRRPVPVGHHGGDAQGDAASQTRTRHHHGPHLRHRHRSQEPERLVRGQRVGRAVQDGEPRQHLHADLRRGRIVSRWARSRSTRRTRTSSGSAPARTTTSAASPSATAIYKSIDAGKTWKRMGLENSEHIQNIVIDPRNSNIVYVTAIGPLWRAGRRPRTVQDDRRRRDVEERPARHREQRRHRHRDGSAEARHDLRRDAAAAARRRAVDRRRTRQRYFQEHGRRREVHEADEGSARRSKWAASGSASTRRTRTRSTRS